jgi:hypothetical protein
MAWLFAQMWMLELAAFLLGAAATWVAFVRPPGPPRAPPHRRLRPGGCRSRPPPSRSPPRRRARPIQRPQAPRSRSSMRTPDTPAAAGCSRAARSTR